MVPCGDCARVGPARDTGPAVDQASVQVEAQVVPEPLRGGLVSERVGAILRVHYQLERARLGMDDVAGLRAEAAVDHGVGLDEPVRIAEGGPAGGYRPSLEVALEGRVSGEVGDAVAVVVLPCRAVVREGVVLVIDVVAVVVGVG